MNQHPVWVQMTIAKSKKTPDERVIVELLMKRLVPSEDIDRMV